MRAWASSSEVDQRLHLGTAANAAVGACQDLQDVAFKATFVHAGGAVLGERRWSRCEWEQRKKGRSTCAARNRRPFCVRSAGMDRQVRNHDLCRTPGWMTGTA